MLLSRIPLVGQIVSGAAFQRTAYAAVVALLFAGLLVQSVRIDGLKVSLPIIGSIGFTGLVEKLNTAKDERDKANAELQRLAEASERQKAETERRIKEARKRVETVERTVTELENRPLPQACATPDVKEWGAVL